MPTEDSVAIVTGASQGIGRATAVRLAHDFSAVVLAARNKDELENTADSVSTAGSPEVGAGAQPYGGRSSAKISCGGGHRAFRRAGRNFPSPGLHGLTRCKVDDGSLCAHGWRRSRGHLIDVMEAPGLNTIAFGR